MASAFIFMPAQWRIPETLWDSDRRGKTSSMAVWLIALWRDNDDLEAGTRTIVPRRLVYVVAPPLRQEPRGDLFKHENAFL